MILNINFRYLQKLFILVLFPASSLSLERQSNGLNKIVTRNQRLKEDFSTALQALCCTWSHFAMHCAAQKWPCTWNLQCLYTALIKWWYNQPFLFSSLIESQTETIRVMVTRSLHNSKMMLLLITTTKPYSQFWILKSNLFWFIFNWIVNV